MLGRAVSSVLGQSFQDFELIVVDDGSAEACVLPDDRRIRLISNPSSLGVAEARNVGIAAAVGKYISFLDDDDEYLSSFLSSTHLCLKDTPDEVGISWCGVVFIDHSSDAHLPHRLSVRKFPEYQDREALLRDFLSVGTGHGVTIKASCSRKVGPFNSALKVSSDTDMFFRILEQGFTPLAVPGMQVIRHRHCGIRLTSSTLNPQRIRIWEDWIFMKHGEFLDQYPDIRGGLKGYVESLRNKPAPNSWLSSRLLGMKAMLAGIF